MVVLGKGVRSARRSGQGPHSHKAEAPYEKESSKASFGPRQRQIWPRPSAPAYRAWERKLEGLASSQQRREIGHASATLDLKHVEQDAKVEMGYDHGDVERTYSLNFDNYLTQVLMQLR